MTKIVSAKADGTIRRNINTKQPSTHSRIKFLLRELGIEQSEWQREQKWRKLQLQVAMISQQ